MVTYPVRSGGLHPRLWSVALSELSFFIISSPGAYTPGCGLHLLAPRCYTSVPEYRARRFYTVWLFTFAEQNTTQAPSPPQGQSPSPWGRVGERFPFPYGRAGERSSITLLPSGCGVIFIMCVSAGRMSSASSGHSIRHRQPL